MNRHANNAVIETKSVACYIIFYSCLWQHTGAFLEHLYDILFETVNILIESTHIYQYSAPNPETILHWRDTLMHIKCILIWKQCTLYSRKYNLRRSLYIGRSYQYIYNIKHENMSITCLLFREMRLTYWRLEKKMAVILQTTFSHAFSWMKIYENHEYLINKRKKCPVPNYADDICKMFRLYEIKKSESFTQNTIECYLLYYRLKLVP